MIGKVRIFNSVSGLPDVSIKLRLDQYVRHFMNWKLLQERLTYAAMSAFVLWQTLVIVVAPAPETSDIVKGIRVVITPYLRLLRQDNEWNFFAWNDGGNSVLAYIVTDAGGTSYTFDAGARLNRFQLSYFWYRDWYQTVLENPDEFGKPFAASFCREQAALSPVSISLIALSEQKYTSQDWLAGKRPLDPEFAETKVLKNFKCPP